jgi:hypothetical protein
MKIGIGKKKEDKENEMRRNIKCREEKKIKMDEKEDK